MTYDSVVIGAGQAGLAAGYHLRRSNLRFAMLEAASGPAGAWPHSYDSLTLFSPARYSALPGLPFPGDPDRYPARDEVIGYLRNYALHFELPIIAGTRVQEVRAAREGFEVVDRAGATLEARSVIAATGSFNRRYMPVIAGQE